MKRRIVSIAFSVLFLVLLQSAGSAFGAEDEYEHQYRQEADQVLGGTMVVANRNAGTISIISTITDRVEATIDLPGANAEPMYVVYARAGNRVFVGDRANDRVVAFNAHDFTVEGIVAAGAGVFHMWINPQNNRLWVNNDIDNTATVINPLTLDVLATVPMPEDLVLQGGKPHDVVLDTKYAYVTMVNLPEEDYVVKFSLESLEEVGRAIVGRDSHVSLTLSNGLLYVPSQNSGLVFVLNRRTLHRVAEIPVPGAHGAGMPRNGQTFYTTNLPGGGVEGLFAIDTRSNAVIGEAVDTPFPVPHNIALTPNGRKLYVTHSGATADKVTIYTVSKLDGLPVFSGEATVGLNPFGLAFVP